MMGPLKDFEYGGKAFSVNHLRPQVSFAFEYYLRLFIRFQKLHVEKNLLTRYRCRLDSLFSDSSILMISEF